MRLKLEPIQVVDPRHADDQQIERQLLPQLAEQRRVTGRADVQPLGAQQLMCPLPDRALPLQQEHGIGLCVLIHINHH
jgi:hypothetical protein